MPMGRRSGQHRQLEQLGRLIEPAVETGEGHGLVRYRLQCMGGGQLHAVVGPQGKGIGKTPCCLDKLLADLNDRERLPGLDQVLAGLLEIVATGRVFPLAAGQPCHRFSPGDPAHRDRFSAGPSRLHLIGAGLPNQQLDQGAGVAEQDHQLNPGPRSPCHW